MKSGDKVWIARTDALPGSPSFTDSMMKWHGQVVTLVKLYQDHDDVRWWYIAEDKMQFVYDERWFDVDELAAAVQAEAEAIIRDAMRFRAWWWRRNTKFAGSKLLNSRLIKEIDDAVSAGNLMEGPACELSQPTMTK